MGAVAQHCYGLLKEKLTMPCFSGQEDTVAQWLCTVLQGMGMAPQRLGHNVVLWPQQPSKPVLALISHTDTVPPAPGYAQSPHQPTEAEGKLIALGANDSGASLFAMLGAYIQLSRFELPFHLAWVAAAGEETGLPEGLPLVLGQLLPAMAVVGEPTSMVAAVAERGLLVLDVIVPGIAGHAARNNGVNAIYEAMPVLQLLRDLQLGHPSEVLPPTSLQITAVHAGGPHNVVPDACHITVDIRLNETISPAEALEAIMSLLPPTVEVNARSLNKPAHATPMGHPLLAAVQHLGLGTSASPTLSDWSRLGNIPAIKLGPGDSQRSHTANEYILKTEFLEGIAGYSALITTLAHLYHSQHELFVERR